MAKKYDAPFNWGSGDASRCHLGGQGGNSRKKKSMKKLPLPIIALTVGVGLVLGLAGCCSIVKSCLQQTIIVKQPESRAVYTNSDVTFSVTALEGPPFSTNGISYQWQFNPIQLIETNVDLNFSNILGATSSSITITNAQTNNVGFYRVLVNATNASEPAALQLIIVGSFTVLGTPVVGSGTKACPGHYDGYVKYNTGWSVTNYSMAASGANVSSGTLPRVEYLGSNGDSSCANNSVSTSIPPGSPYYVFTIYLNSPVPSGNYVISLNDLR